MPKEKYRYDIEQNKQVNAVHDSLDQHISIYYDVHARAWGMMLEENETKDNSPKVVGEIACTDPMTLSFISPENILKTEPLSDL